MSSNYCSRLYPLLLCSFGLVLGIAGLGFTQFFAQWTAQRLFSDATGRAMGLLSIFNAGFSCLLIPVMSFSDRIGSRRPFIVSTGFLFSVSYLLLILFPDAKSLFVVAYCLNNGCYIVASSAIGSLLMDVSGVGTYSMKTLNAVFYLEVNLGIFFVSMLVSDFNAFLLAHITHVYLIIIILCLVFSLIFVWLRLPASITTSNNNKKSSLGELKAHPRLISFVIGRILLAVGFTSYSYLNFAARDLVYGKQTWAQSVAASLALAGRSSEIATFGAVGITGLLSLLGSKFNSKFVILTGAVLASSIYFLFIFTGFSYTLILVGEVLLSFAACISSCGEIACLNAVTPSHLSATAMSTYTALITVFNEVGSVVYGPLLDWLFVSHHGYDPSSHEHFTRYSEFGYHVLFMIACFFSSSGTFVWFITTIPTCSSSKEESEPLI